MYTSTRTAENFYFFGDTPQGKGYAVSKKSTDYTPYGTLLHHRHGQESTTDYRYGFQGQEADDELKGEGNSYNYTYRMHDPRIGRFFAIDPLAPKYPFYTPYAFSGNRVIDSYELEGLEPVDSDGNLIPADVGNAWFQGQADGSYQQYDADGVTGYWNEGDPQCFLKIEGTENYGYHHITNDPWDPNYGLLFDNNGFALQDGYSMQFIEQERFHNRLVANANALDNFTLFMFSTPLLAFGASTVILYTAASPAVVYLGSTQTVLGTSGMLTTTTGLQATLTAGMVWTFGEGYFGTSLIKTTLDIAGQAAVNGFDQIQYGDAIATGFFPTIPQVFYCASFDDKSGVVTTVFDGTKSMDAFMTDGTYKFAFNTTHGGGSIFSQASSEMNQLAPQYTPIFNSFWSMGGKQANKKAKQGL